MDEKKEILNEAESIMANENKVTESEAATEYADDEVPAFHDSHMPARELLEWVEMFSFSLALVVFMLSFVCRFAVVSGESMEKTLYDGEVLLVSDLFYEPKQGDIIVFQSPTILHNAAVVKRVIALEGQVVDIDFEKWVVTVDGVPLDEPYVNYLPEVMRGSDYTFPVTVEEGKIFVMGDNRNKSSDSRSVMIGQVDTRYVLGRLITRVLPLQKFGAVN